MAVGVGFVGRQLTMTVGGATLVGIVEKALSRTNEAIEVTDDQSNGWAEFLAVPGKKSATLSVSGPLKNLELVDTFFEASQIVACVLTYPDGSTETFDAFLESIETTAPANEGATFSASLLTSGAIAYVAGT